MNFSEHQLLNPNLLNLILANQAINVNAWNHGNLLLAPNLLHPLVGAQSLAINHAFSDPYSYLALPREPMSVLPVTQQLIPHSPFDPPTLQNVSEEPIVTTEPCEHHSSNTSSEPSIPFEMGSLPTSTYYPTHFMRGTQLQLANGEIKKVEDLSSDDFLKCAAESTDVMVNASIVRSIKTSSAGSVTIVFETGMERHQIPLRCQIEQPYYVLGKGWCSCDPQKSAENYGLDCGNLEENDVCVVLTKKDDECAVDIVTAEKDMEEFSQRAALREKMSEVYYEHVSGRVSAPPERISVFPSAIHRLRRLSE